MHLIWLPICSLFLGAAIGSIFTFTVPIVFAKYLSVAILAALDSVLGGIRSILEDSFDSYIMLTGFFTNALLAAGLAFFGDKIGVDMYLAATVCFGLRLFSNLGYIRRFLINKLYTYRENKKVYNNKKLVKLVNPSHLDNIINTEDNTPAPIANIPEATEAQGVATNVHGLSNLVENEAYDPSKKLEIPGNIFLENPPKKPTAKSKSNEQIIENMIDEDMKEYVKIKEQRQHRKQ